MTYDVRDAPAEVIHTALCCAEDEAAIDEVDERAARAWLAELIASRDTALRLAEQRAGALETREIQVKRLLMAVQFELNSLPTMREETRAAGLAHVADQIERNRVGLETIMASVESLKDALAATPPPQPPGDGAREGEGDDGD